MGQQMVKTLHRFFLIAALLFAAAAAGELPVDKRLVTGRLANGFSYTILPNAKPKGVVSLRLLVRAGSLEETREQRGLAHFIEHMAFNGTRHFAKNELVEYLESIGMSFGGDINAETTYEHTLYKLDVPVSAKHLDKALSIIHDWAEGVSFDPAEFEKERGVVLEEKRLRDTPRYRISLQFTRLFFDGSAYAAGPVIGEESVLKNAPVSRAIAFYRRWYRPDLMHLIVVGDLDPGTMERRIRRVFADLPVRSGPAPASRRIREHNATRVAYLHDPELKSPSVEIDYAVWKKGRRSKEDFRRDLENVFVALLFNVEAQKVLLRGGSDAVAMSLGFEQITPFLKIYRFLAIFNEGHREGALEDLYALMRRLAEKGFSETEFGRLRRQLLIFSENDYRQRRNTPSAKFAAELASGIETGEVFIDEDYDYNLTKRLLGEFTPDDINRRLKEILAIPDRVIAFSGKRATPLPAGRIEELLKSAEAKAKQTVSAEEKPAAELPPPPAPAKIVSKRYDPESGIYSYRLENNITVDFKPKQEVRNVVTLSAWSPGGLSALPLKDLDNAAKASRWVLDSAPGGFGPTELTTLVVGGKISYLFTIARYGEVIIGSSSTEGLERMLALIRLQILRPKITPEVARQERRTLQTLLSSRERDPAYRFERALQRYYYKNNPRILFDSNASIAELDPEQMLAIFKTKFGDMNHFHFAFAGDVKPGKLEALIRRYLGTLPTRADGERSDTRQYDYRRGEQRFERRLNRTSITQTTLRYRAPIPFSLEKNAAANALGQILSVRLRKRIREEKSGTYTIGVGCEIAKEHRDNAECIITFAADPARADELLEEVHRAVETFVAQGPTSEELHNYKTEFTVNYPILMRDNKSWLTMMIDSKRYGIPMKRYLALPKIIGAMKPEAVQEVARRIFGGDLLIAQRLPQKNSGESNTTDGHP